MPLEKQIELIRKQFLIDLDALDNSEQIDNFRLLYLGRNGKISALFKKLTEVNTEEKPVVGKVLNELKKDLSSVFLDKVKYINRKDNQSRPDFIDFSLPGKDVRIGSSHILEQTLSEIKDIWKSIGFHVAYGPEVDDEYHNFTALNIPEHHPSRDMQDTFFINPSIVMRTHTSNVQVHLMENNEPPLRYIVPGRVYRNEAVGYKSYCLFHQVEGIYINEKVSFSELKGSLEYFVKQMFGNKKRMRFRPSYFPFTEPSAEVDIWDERNSQWMEILGCGMVDPSVLDNVGYDSKKHHGYAFGMGVERISMIKHNIKDIRHFYNGDIRFLEQFT